MASPSSARKQILDRIKEVTNILVTVSKNPSVDELSAALALTIFLNKLGKHATAVASGEMPRAIDFLEPDKTFEETADSLRDFIIALDKEKADHLRYKLEGEVVKIFITPFRTTISSDDLEFSQGDYNVEMVIGLNVVNEQELDNALAAHGKILHDATVVTITSGDIESSLGTTDWHNKSVSSVSEMIADLIGSLKTSKAGMDEQISTALLTGIVASTDRFSNSLTSSRVMTVAAELMAAGANQQLIVAHLEDATEEVYDNQSYDTTQTRSDGSVLLEADAPTKVMPTDTLPDASNSRTDDLIMTIDHKDEDKEEQEEISTEGMDQVDLAAHRVSKESKEQAALEAEERLSAMTQNVVSGPSDTPVTSIVDELRKGLEDQPVVARATSPVSGMSEPLIGGTLNATTDQASEDKRREIEKDRNRTILTHNSPGSGYSPQRSDVGSPMNSSMAPNDEPSVADIFSNTPALPPVLSEAPQSRQGQLVDEAQSVASSNYMSTMDDVDAAFATSPVTSDEASMPSLFSSSAPSSGLTIAKLEEQARATASAETSGSAPQSDPSTDRDFSAMPPMPDFTNLPPLPPALNDGQLDQFQDLGLPPPPVMPVSPSDASPAKFQIPGQ